MDDAIRVAVASNGWPGLVANSIVLVDYASVDDDGPESGVLFIFPQGEASWATSLGMVEGGRLMLHRQFTDRTTDDDEDVD